MLKNDRGTILYLRLFYRGVEAPSVIDVFSGGIAGFTIDTESVDLAFEDGTVSSKSETAPNRTIRFIKSSGSNFTLVEHDKSIDNFERMEFTVVYPDGSTKIGRRTVKDDIDTVVWDDNLVAKLRSIKPDYYWTGENLTNPALLFIKGGIVVDRACDHSTRGGCGGA